MIARLLISADLITRKKTINQELNLILENWQPESVHPDLSGHPDLLYIEADTKLGIEQAKKIKSHFTLRPYSAKGRVAVLEDAAGLTIDAQNALLKTLEELPSEAVLILAAKSESTFLPTVLSRLQITQLEKAQLPLSNTEYNFDKLLTSSIEQRFEYIESLKDKKAFLAGLINYFHQRLPSLKSADETSFVGELLQAEEWAAQNVNIRAILEYLMLVMPI